MTYGLISETDARTLEKTIDLILTEFNDTCINITEVGLFNCQTLKGMKNYILSKKRAVIPIGVDNEKDKPIKDLEWLNFIKGDSSEVYHQIGDNSQHILFLDACHCFAHVISDFFCYAPKVKVGGYLAFHDTGRHIKSFKDFQHGDKENPDAYISVRKALAAIGLIDTKYIALEADVTFLEQWHLVFDEADVDNEAGGICVFKKRHEC